MKRALGFSFVLTLLAPSLAFSLYSGAPALPNMPEEGFFLSKNSFISVKLGYEGDFLLGRTLDSPLPDSGMKGSLNAGVLSVGFINRLELYMLLGASTVTFSSSLEGQDLKMKTAENLGGEVGIRANTPIWGDMKFGADAKYFYAWPTLSEIERGGASLPPLGTVFQREWQVGVSLSQTFAWFTPYVGGKVSYFTMEYVDLTSLTPWIPSSQFSVSNENRFGAFVGMGIAPRKGVYLDFELRFIDEYALTGALGVSF